jgi:cell division septation protein DedD
MRNNETGEFELTVGNRQLLSGFFIVVLLFAVAFAMGYVVGQNSPRSAKGASETAAAAPPGASDRRPLPAAAAPEPARTEPASAPTETAAPQQPPASEPAPQQPAAQPSREPETPKPPANPDAAPVLADLPGPAGSFWQVIAVAEPDAQVIASALKKKGFPAFLSPGSKNLMRVMVGPYNDAAALGKAKTDLANAGFPNPFRK